jgi:uncharacterized protein related to proFAR isomerase
LAAKQDDEVLVKNVGRVGAKASVKPEMVTKIDKRSESVDGFIVFM